MIISVGIIGAISNRLGRKLTFSVAIGGQLLSFLSWFLIFTFPSVFQNYWKPLVIGMYSIQALCGGVLILILVAFGIVGDISSRNPSIRAMLFISFDLMGSIASIFGSQVAALLMRVDLRYIVSLVCLGYLLNIIGIVLFLPETLEEKIRSQPIDLKKANTIGQLAFLLPLKTTKELLRSDAQKVYNKISHLYKLQGLGDTPGSTDASMSFNMINHPRNIDHAYQVYEDNIDCNNPYQITSSPSPSSLSSPSSSSPSKNQAYTPKNDSPQYNENTTELEPASTLFMNGTLMGPSEMYPLVADHEGHESPLMPNTVARGGDRFSLNSSGVGHSEGNLRSDIDELDKNGIPRLKLSKPPRLFEHSNSFPMLVLCLFLNLLVALGSSVCFFYYLKKIYQATPQEYSNVISLAAVARTIGSFLLFPLFTKYIKTPTGEKFLLVTLIILQAVFFCVMPICQNMTQFVCVLLINDILNTFPSGLIRSLVSNQVSQRLQQHILSAIASTQVFVFVFGGLVFNLIWVQTQDEHPTYILYSFALISLISAIFPLLISDSAENFNLRIEMTMEYTKIRAAEKALEAKKAAEMEEEHDKKCDNLEQNLIF
jgi:MFS family permease